MARSEPMHDHLTSVAGRARPLLARSAVAAWLLAGLFGWLPENTGAETPPKLLHPSEPVRRALSEGQTHRYRFETGEAGIWRVRVAQHGVAVRLTITGRAKARTVDGPMLRYGPESQIVEAPGPGSYEVLVEASRKGVPPGEYEVVAEPVRRDGPRIRSEWALMQGDEAHSVETAQGYAEAESHYEEALALSREFTAGRLAASIHFSLGWVREWNGDTSAALAHFTRAAELYGAAGERDLEALSIKALGSAHLFRGELDEAEQYLRRVLQAFDDAYWRGIVQNNLCLAAQYRGLASAGDCFLALLPQFDRVGDRWEAATVHNNLGLTYSTRGEPHLARQHLENALAIRQELENAHGAAQTLNNLALLERRIGNIEAAVGLYREALEIWERIGHQREAANTLHNIGVAYLYLGEEELALGFLERALEGLRAAGNSRESITLQSLAYAHGELGQPDIAARLLEEYLEKSLAGDDLAEQGVARRRLGQSYTAAGDLVRGLTELDRAIEILAQTADRRALGRAWQERGDNLMQQQRLGEAEESLNRALAIQLEIEEPYESAETLHHLALLHRARGQLEAALRFSNEAVEKSDSVRRRVLNPARRASLAGQQQAFYALRVTLLMDLDQQVPGRGYAEQALVANERRLARSLTEILAESHADLYEGIDPELAARRRELQERASAKAAYLSSVAHTDEDTAREVEHELDSIRVQLDVLEREARERRPALGHAEEPLALSPAGMRALLDEDTVLLEYFLGEDASYAWAISATSIESFRLPPKPTIEALARQFYDDISHLLVGADRCYYAADARTLSAAVLGPLTDPLSHERLVIVPDGVLAYVPFAALPDPREPTTDLSCYAPLALEHEILEVPSASTLALQRQLTASPPVHLSSIAVLADPVFEVTDPRLAQAPGSGSSSTRPGHLSEQPVFQRLPSTTAEAEAIRAAGHGATVNVWLGLDATRQTLMEHRLAGYQVVHLATHGVIDDHRPELSSLMLSQYEASGERIDGFLRLQDIFSLDLSARLVVLSGCDTALGKQTQGEGLIGLTRGFMYAGAQSVMASLWRIQDTATSELMRHFYSAMLEQQPAAAALRQAQLRLARDPRWQHPYFWGAFIVQGDWR